MSEMVERVAKALRAEMAYAELADVCINEHRMEQIARAAIAAMREPTDEMAHVGFIDAGNLTWEVMIDEALR